MVDWHGLMNLERRHAVSDWIHTHRDHLAATDVKTTNSAAGYHSLTVTFVVFPEAVRSAEQIVEQINENIRRLDPR